MSKPKVLEVGTMLSAGGVPLAAVMDAAQRLRDDVDDIARQFVALVETHVFEPLGEPLPTAERPRLAALVEGLRSLALEIVEAELAQAMERQVRDRLGEHLGRYAGRAVGTS